MIQKRFPKTLFLLICLLPLGLSAQWTQVGSSINGEAEADFFGYSSRLNEDGTVLIVGGRQNDDGALNAGHARVFEWSGEDWTQKGSDIDGVYLGEAFGTSVSINTDGTVVAVGGTDVFNELSGDGVTRVYEWNGVGWWQRGESIFAETSGIEYSGSAVDLSADGSIVAIGSISNANTMDDQGHVRVFQWTGLSWFQLGQDIDGEAAFDYSGGTLSLSDDGTIIAIGASGNDDGGNASGQARVYAFNGASWQQVGSDIDGANEGDGFGTSVSLSADGQTLAVGAETNADNGTFSGEVRIFDWNGIAWIQRGEDINGEAILDLFGEECQISSDGNKVAVLARGSNEFQSALRIFEWSENAWSQIGTSILGAAPVDGGIAASMSISGDGNKVLFGTASNDENGENAGQVRVFEFIQPLGIESQNQVQIKAFPNPSKGHFTVSAKDQIESIQLHSLDGRIVYTTQPTDTNQTVVDLGNTTSGQYVLSVKTDQETAHLLLVIE
jgi:hypothetical protein